MDDLDALDVAMPIPGCWDGIDNDGDFLIDMADPDCTFVLDPLEAPDSDGDAISNALDSDDDGDGVLTLGSAECSLPGWAGTTAAPCCVGPGLGTCATDNCQYEPNPTQSDVGGAGVTANTPDGIGDACQCGDVNNDGRANGTDGIVYNRANLGLNPYFLVSAMPGYPAKCNVNTSIMAPGGGCTGSDALAIARYALGLLPMVQQTCDATLP
jgi:hypothetical protein